MAGVRLAFPSFLLRNPPTDQRDLAGLITGIVGPDHLAAQGLPSSSTGVLIDGMIVNGARYSPSPARGERAAGLNLDALRSVAMVSNDIDVEVTGYAGALVRVESRRGTRASGRSAHGLFGNSRMSSSAGFRGGPPDYTSATGGLSLSGPIIADTAHYVFSFQAQQLERPLPRIWELDDAVDARAVEAAREAFDLDLASYTRPNTVRTDILSAFGRVDWRIAGAHHVDVRASVSGLPRILAPRDATLPGAASGSDVWIAAMATSQLMSGLGHELRITGERTLREGAYGLGAWAPTNLDLPSTHIVEGPLDFGPQSGDIDRFQRAGLTASQTVFLQTARHRLKVGTTFGLASYDFTHDPVRAGESFFGSVDAFARHDGLAIVGSGPLRVGRLTQAEYGVYAQDSWSPASDLEVIVGARYDVIRAPSRNARLNERWAQLSDLTTTGLPRTRNSVSPRFALYWRPGPPGRTTFQVSGGVFREPHDPGILADALIQDGSAQIRRSLGTLERWPSPTVSNTNAASLLTLLTPDF